MRASAQPAFEYRLDPQDAVVWVSDDWLAFARENGARQLNAAAVIGKSLWDFIPDEPTRSLYRGVFGTVRATDQSVVLPFRCDSPTLRRFMRLEVRHHAGCGIDLKSIMVRVEPCERRVLFDANAAESSNVLAMCSCCKHVYLEPQGWLPVDEARDQASLLSGGMRPQIRYEVCAACRALAIHQRITAIESRLQETRRDVSTEANREWERLNEERARLTHSVEVSSEK